MSAAWAVETLLAASAQDGLEDLPDDNPLGPSEEAGGRDGGRRHRQLLEAVTSLDGKRRWKFAERSEASLKVSEFTVSAEGLGERLVLSDLLEPFKASPSLATVKKQLDRVRSKKAVELPFTQEEVARTRREVAFHQTSRALSRWDPVVLKDRQAQQLVFPRGKEQPAFAPTEHMLSGWEARTPLEQEILSLLCKNKQPVRDPLLTPMEKASLKAMSLEEAKMRRAELQRARALQSYYEARARRERKIKSKKHRRVLKRGKAKKVLREFEKLQQVSPAAPRDLEKLERARMLERMSLKHQSSGKWAKSKAIMAKYDTGARRAVQEQLARNRELTQKLQVASGSEEEEGGTEESNPLLPEVVDEAQVTAEGPNPWMATYRSGATKEAKSQKEPEQCPEPVASEAPESEGGGRPVAEKEVLLKEFEEKRLLRKKSGLSQSAKPVGRQQTKDSNSQEASSESRALSPKFSKDKHLCRKQTVTLVRAVLPVQREGPVGEEEKPLWLPGPGGAEALEEPEERDREGPFRNKEPPGPVLERRQLERQQDGQPGAPEKERKRMIDLRSILTSRSPSTESLAVPTTIEELAGERDRDLQHTIKEAFTGDDVVRDFLKEKRGAVEASKPVDMDLTLPGWGEWAGVGLKPGARRRHRLLIKAPESPPRRDENLPNVIISEKRNIHAAAHQVRGLPYPFTHHQQFERTIQTPIGSTWNTQRAFQKLTAPKVVTKPGHVIKPIRAEDVGLRSSSRSHLSVIGRNPRRLTTHHQKQLKKNSEG
ncbi:U3 small nucleolar RNA-associated protein 14 homolog A-like [Sturnira hondurensis]|uniref:U3 small nucleolar RNA-associated protein 14 homolog A-like n=1 Tax=Sturnira hondurensis TaxID=192404 RepID=UPI001879F96C|nr:U3 small nucleolar RNA-associated protein 14 homolog A-like [Sturnira hondurensis]